MARHQTSLKSSQWITNKHLAYIFFGVLMVGFSQLLLVSEPYNLIPFAVICGTIFVAATFLYPMAGMFLYLFFYLVRPQELFPQLSIMHYPYEKFIAIFVALSIVINYLIRKRKFEFYNLDYGILGLILVMGISVPTAIWVGGALDTFIIVAKRMVLFFFLTRIVTSQKHFATVVWFYVLTVGFIAISAAYNYYQGHFEVAMGIERAAGLGGEEGVYSDPNSMAASLVLGMPLVYYMLKSYRNTFLRVIMIGIFLACLWTVIISGSRGGMLGAIIVLGLIAYNSRHRVVAMVVVVLTIIALALLAPDQYVERFSTIFRFQDLENDVTGAAYSAQGRIKGLLIGLEILLKRPLTGVGMACFGTYNYDNYGTWLQAHNLIGQLAGELGFLGILAFGYFIYLMFANIKRIRRHLTQKTKENNFNYNIATACLISICMLFFLGMFGHNLYRFNWYLLAALVAIIAKLEFRSESQEEAKPAKLTKSTVPTTDGMT